MECTTYIPKCFVYSTANRVAYQYRIAKSRSCPIKNTRVAYSLDEVLRGNKKYHTKISSLETRVLILTLQEG